MLPAPPSRAKPLNQVTVNTITRPGHEPVSIMRQGRRLTEANIIRAPDIADTDASAGADNGDDAAVSAVDNNDNLAFASSSQFHSKSRKEINAVNTRFYYFVVNP